MELNLSHFNNNQVKQNPLTHVESNKNFNNYRRVLVVATNQDTILNTNHAPKEIKYKILRADSLIRQIEYDLNHKENDEYLDSKKTMEETEKRKC